MSIVRVMTAVAVCVVGLLIGPPGVANAAPTRAPARICAPVNASGEGQDLGGGQTTATISSHGVAIGTSTATFTITGMTGTVVSFTGPIVITTLIGTLTAPAAGTLDVSTGVFSSGSTTVTGTGALRSVTGSLTFAGTQDLTSGAFTETITGRLCSSISGLR